MTAADDRDVTSLRVRTDVPAAAAGATSDKRNGCNQRNREQRLAPHPLRILATLEAALASTPRVQPRSFRDVDAVIIGQRCTHRRR